MMFLARPMAMWLFPVIVTMSIKRQQGVERVIHALLKAEIAAKQARSINYQLGVAKLPLAKELAELSLQGTPINGELIAQLATGAFLDDKRNVVLVGGTGTGKSHIAIGLARNIIKAGRKARFYNAVDLANKLEIEAKLDRQGRTADGLMRVNLVSSSAASISRISERSLMVAPLACRHASEPSDWDHGLRLWNRDRLRRLCPVMILIERRQCSNRSLWRSQSSHARRAGRYHRIG